MNNKTVTVKAKSPFITGCPQIENEIAKWYKTDKNKAPKNVFDAIISSMRDEIEIILPVSGEGRDCETLEFCAETDVPQLLEGDGGKNWIAIFTNAEELSKGEETAAVACPLKVAMGMTASVEKCAGVVINPWGDSVLLPLSLCGGLIKSVRPLRQDEIDLNDGAEAYSAGDFETAFRLYKKSADAGNVTAMSNLGYCYYYGRSVAVDKQKAKEIWQKAAILGDVCAIYKLGDMYRNGDLEKDEVFSHALYRKAFAMSVECDDIYSYPDAFLRMMKYYPEEAQGGGKDRKQIAKECIEGLEKRIKEGDAFSDKLLEEAKELFETIPDEQ